MSIYKENKNLVNRFVSEFNNRLRKNGGSRIINYSRELMPSDEDIKMFQVYLRGKLLIDDKVQIVEVGKNLYFCVAFGEASSTRSVSSKYDYDSILASGDIENVVIQIFNRFLRSNRYWMSKDAEIFVTSLQNHLNSKGITTIRKGNVKVLGDREEFARYMDFYDEPACKDAVKDFTPYIKLKAFMESLYNVSIDSYRLPKVFPRVKDKELMPLGYFNAEDFTMNVPERNHNSSNWASTNFYGKFPLIGVSGKADGNTKYSSYRGEVDYNFLVSKAITLTPYEIWIYLDIKANNYDVDKYKKAYGLG